MQYEIFAGGSGARPAGRDVGTTVNQTNAKIAPIEIIESEYPIRVNRFELIPDSGGAGQFRGGLGIRREYTNLADARFSIRSMKHTSPPNGCAGGGGGRKGGSWIDPDSAEADGCRPAIATFPCVRAIPSGSTRRAAAATATRWHATPSASSTMSAKVWSRARQRSAIMGS